MHVKVHGRRGGERQGRCSFATAHPLPIQRLQSVHSLCGSHRAVVLPRVTLLGWARMVYPESAPSFQLAQRLLAGAGAVPKARAQSWSTTPLAKCTLEAYLSRLPLKVCTWAGPLAANASSRDFLPLTRHGLPGTHRVNGSAAVWHNWPRPKGMC